MMKLLFHVTTLKKDDIGNLQEAAVGQFMISNKRSFQDALFLATKIIY